MKKDNNLSKFPGDTDSPTDSIVSNQQSPQSPAPEMAECKDVDMRPHTGYRYVRAIHGVLLKGQVVSSLDVCKCAI